MKTSLYKSLFALILALYTAMAVFTIILFLKGLLLIKIIIVLAALYGYSEFFKLFKLKTEEETENDWFVHILHIFIVCAAFALLLAFSI